MRDNTRGYKEQFKELKEKYMHQFIIPIVIELGYCQTFWKCPNILNFMYATCERVNIASTTMKKSNINLERIVDKINIGFLIYSSLVFI